MHGADCIEGFNQDFVKIPAVRLFNCRGGFDDGATYCFANAHIHQIAQRVRVLNNHCDKGVVRSCSCFLVQHPLFTSKRVQHGADERVGFGGEISRERAAVFIQLVQRNAVSDSAFGGGLFKVCLLIAFAGESYQSVSV